MSRILFYALVYFAVLTTTLNLGEAEANRGRPRYDRRYDTGVWVTIKPIVCTRNDPTGLKKLRLNRPLCGVHFYMMWSDQQDCTIEERA